jgi:hypothetical protein
MATQLSFGPYTTTMSNTFSSAVVSGVVIDIYDSSGAVPSGGGGAYTATTDNTGLAYINFGGSFTTNWLIRATYPIGAWDSTKPTFTYVNIKELWHYDW